jgi:hypothetical protein
LEAAETEVRRILQEVMMVMRQAGLRSNAEWREEFELRKEQHMADIVTWMAIAKDAADELQWLQERALRESELAIRTESMRQGVSRGNHHRVARSVPANQESNSIHHHRESQGTEALEELAEVIDIVWVSDCDGRWIWSAVCICEVGWSALKWIRVRLRTHL